MKMLLNFHGKCHIELSYLIGIAFLIIIILF